MPGLQLENIGTPREKRVFDRALTDSQIRAIVAAGSSGKCSQG